MTHQLDRQSFLGEDSGRIIADLCVGIVGLGGGGSHIAQQLAHVGVQHFVLIDPDIIDSSNLNRLIGGTVSDVLRKRWKTAIAARQIKRINPRTRVLEIRDKWQFRARDFRHCDVLFGAVDSFTEREQLEKAARRYIIPYIDIGMDVFSIGSQYAISGQVALSMPGQSCLRCMGVIREDTLANEANNYGGAGSMPQVVWPNGVLASLAVGIAIQLVTPWHSAHSTATLLEYDGNLQEIKNSESMAYVPIHCPHFDSINLNGDPWYHLPIRTLSKGGMNELLYSQSRTSQRN
jgi:molybdopterin/thiamine biosynthesis adenylyltransferase